VDAHEDAEPVRRERNDASAAAERAPRLCQLLELRTSGGSAQELVIGQPAYLVETAINQLPQLRVDDLHAARFYARSRP